MIALEGRDDGVVLRVQARPAARQTGILGEHDGALKFGVTAAPEKGQANRALIEGLADALNLRRSQFLLLSGTTSRTKRFLVRGLSQSELARRLETALSNHNPP